MLKLNILAAGALAAVLAAASPARALAQEAAKPAVEVGKFDGEGDGVARYCANIAPSAAEARVAWQMKRLAELDGQIKQKVAELDAKEAEAREWISKREDLLKKAEDDIVAIYGKMQPEAAAARLIAMDDSIAAAILSKLNPRGASAILGEMEVDKAARLTDLMSGAASADGKKS
jgi:flagellar motility protein MotE (MotC chaperone)